MSDITEPTPDETPAVVEDTEEDEVEAHGVKNLQDLEPSDPGISGDGGGAGTSNASLLAC
ncbi:hypothetical protein ACIRQQ_11010 [Streptomyces fuscichromogenes]|uniref:hypothetical protein n=1 Tax=Streptomyces fuscichromogenes TaxID=1324013 RepID=UPI0038295BF6